MYAGLFVQGCKHRYWYNSIVGSLRVRVVENEVVLAVFFFFFDFPKLLGKDMK